MPYFLLYHRVALNIGDVIHSEKIPGSWRSQRKLSGRCEISTLLDPVSWNPGSLCMRHSLNKLSVLLHLVSSPCRHGIKVARLRPLRTGIRDLCFRGFQWIWDVHKLFSFCVVFYIFKISAKNLQQFALVLQTNNQHFYDKTMLHSLCTLCSLVIVESIIQGCHLFLILNYSFKKSTFLRFFL